MEKIYKLLPWLNAKQAVDWLSRLTETEMSEELLISLCEAGHAAVFVDVGACCRGTNYETWTGEVCASGKQMVIDPSVLNGPVSHQATMTLRGEVLETEGGTVEKVTIDWFPSNLQTIILCFKQADVLALADKINADEHANRAELIAESMRAKKDRAEALQSLHQAQVEISALQDKLDQAHDQLNESARSQSSRNSELLAIAGLLRLVQGDNRPRYNQGTIVAAISALGWAGAGASSLNHLFAEANKAAREANSDAEAKVEARMIATQESCKT